MPTARVYQSHRSHHGHLSQGCEAGALRGRARDYAAATLRNLALDDENMEVIAQMDAVAPLVAQAYLLTTGCALRASRRAAHAPKRDPLYNSCQFERLVRNNRWRARRPPVAQSDLGGRLRRDAPLLLPLPLPAHHHCLEDCDLPRSRQELLVGAQHHHVGSAPPLSCAPSPHRGAPQAVRVQSSLQRTCTDFGGCRRTATCCSIQ